MYKYVLKFGGTSQVKSTYDMILDRINITKDSVKYVIVLSAMSGVTNKLIDYQSTKNTISLNWIINKNTTLSSECGVSIDDEITNLIKLSYDDIGVIAQGEYLTCGILNKYLNKNNIKSELISSLDVIESNQENIGLNNKGEFIVYPEKIEKSLETNDVVIIPGFSGRTPNGSYCLLGRGGSDTTGSIIASSINAKLYEIWTDVNGIYSSDPRKISGTFINEIINYDAAQEVAAMGAKVIHPYCILPCAQKKIPIHIKNTFNPEGNSTIIYNDKTNKVYGITIQENVKVFKITSMNMWNNYGFVYDIFSIFKDANVDINIINTSQFNITTTTDEIDEKKLIDIKLKLENKYQVELSFNNSIISIVGDNIRMINNIGDIFKLTKNYNIITTSYSSNDMSLSFVIETLYGNKLAQDLHNLIFNNININIKEVILFTE